VSHRLSNRAWLNRAGALLVAASVCGGSVACSKKKQEDGKAEAEKAKAEKDKKPTGDRYQDGTKLAGALKDWQKRWADTADLPACDPLLKDAAELELCKTAQNALVAAKAAVAKPEPEATLIHLTAELAYATEAASEKLRSASMEKLQQERKTAAATSASGKPLTAPPPSAAAKLRALGSAAKPGDKLKELQATPTDPGMQVMQAYSRVNRASLRYLGQFLQFGPLATRTATFTEVEALSKRKEAWPALGRTLREAAMAENDPDLQGKLKALAPKMSRRSQGAGAAPEMMQRMPPSPAGLPPGANGLPAGHPPMPGREQPE
jgi:hypothetical protein